MPSTSRMTADVVGEAVGAGVGDAVGDVGAWVNIGDALGVPVGGNVSAKQIEKPAPSPLWVVYQRNRWPATMVWFVGPKPPTPVP